MRRLLLLAALLVVPALGHAQTVSSGLISPEAARRVGLERMWFTQLGLDRGRGRMSGLFMYVSPIRSHKVYQITQGGRRYVFSQRDRNAFGEEIGADAAKEQAE